MTKHDPLAIACTVAEAWAALDSETRNDIRESIGEEAGGLTDSLDRLHGITRDLRSSERSESEPIVEIPGCIFSLSDDRGDVVLGVRESENSQLYEVRMSKAGAEMLVTKLARHLKQSKSQK